MFRETNWDIYSETGDSIFYNKTSKVEVEPNSVIFQIYYVKDSEYYNFFVPIYAWCYFSYGSFFYNLGTKDNSKKGGMLQRYLTFMESKCKDAKNGVKILCY